MTDRQWGATSFLLISIAIILFVITYFIPVESSVLVETIWLLNAIRVISILIGCIGTIMLGNWLSDR